MCATGTCYARSNFPPAGKFDRTNSLPDPAPPGARARHASTPTLERGMTFHDETFQRVSIAEAARALGVSTSTVRRMVKAGRLVGESVLRPQGSAYVVRLPLDVS